MEEAIVLYPSAGVGHLISMVELAKFILKHCPSFSIKVLLYKSPFTSLDAITQYIDSVSTTTPSINFHHLPTAPIPPESSSLNVEVLAYELPRLNNPNLRHALRTILEKSQIKAFILDFFNDFAFDVTDELKIPTYYFFTSSASSLTVFLYFPTFRRSKEDFKDVNKLLEIPGWASFPASNIPETLHVRNSYIYRRFLEGAEKLPKSQGILVNTFKSLEKRTVRSLVEGPCVPDGQTSPIYCVRLLLSTNEGTEHECLSWLSTQPSKSVVFLCFGSVGLFSVTG